MADYYGLFASEARSVSDGESDGERRLRRSRRKRGGGRYRPYSPGNSDEETAKDFDKKQKNKRAEKPDRFGMAPPNSTQFLLDDREARADAEFENEQRFEAAERRRVRTMSGSYDHMRPAYWCTIEPATTTTYHDDDDRHDVDSGSSSSGESEADREMEREFETDYLEVKRERIQSMTKSQLAAELLERDQDTQQLARELGSKESENQHLRKLLYAHGISPDEPVTSTTTIDVVVGSKSPVIAN
ncbi:hypothetical protein GCK72_010917 [Caenorhabditis remanei]|uniref:Uncharacterized protein n=2 Tax=Caenorhabditis remanei TaxID=31234 RepID=E3LWA8_CAERE|nr:hypothetical protein GCK72_010917 [Caenorhabditis remanei]EFO83470.1 hypothetical protein CRE_03050 [Caenorhabditis remanei]KAF1762655.1 hypothetical protein GCK72_010917 [Caenorhabditis remanei]